MPDENEKKLKVPQEIAYLVAIVVLALGVSMSAAADFGMSMIAAPAYILSLRVEALSFGQAEYVVQAVMLVIMCLILRRIKPIYLFSFVTCLIYGLVLDAERSLIRPLNPAVVAPGAFPMPVRIALFVGSILVTAFAVALFFRSLFFPQVHDMFVALVSRRYKIPLTKFKLCYDIGALLVSLAMTLLLLGRIEGIGPGTVVIAFVNGPLIGLAGKLIDNAFEFTVGFPKLAALFETD